MTNREGQTPPTCQNRGSNERENTNNYTLPSRKVKRSFDKDRVKSAVDCRRYLTERLGARQIEGDRYTAPWRNNEAEDNPGLAVQERCWTDYKDGGSGDIFNLIMKGRNCEFKEALAEAADFAGIAPVEKKKTDAWKIIYNQASDTDLDRVSRYLKSRGLPGETPPGTRFHPKLKHGNHLFPAMVCPVKNAKGEMVGIHRTFLDPDEDGKANVNPERKMLGKCAGGAVHLLDIHGDVIAVVEGIETGISVQNSTGFPTWATLSTSGMKAIQLPDEIKKVFIFGDNDKLNKEGKRPGQDAAAKLAERLAAEGREVFVVIPDREGDDWLDVLVKDGAELIRRAKDGAKRFESTAMPGPANQSDTSLPKRTNGLYLDPETSQELTFDQFVSAMASRGELGDGFIFAETQRENWVHNFTNESWLQYAGGIFELDRTERVFVTIQKQLRQLYIQRGAWAQKRVRDAVEAKDDEAQKAAQAEAKFFFGRAKEFCCNRHVKNVSIAAARRMGAVNDDFDADPDLMAVENGVLHLRTLEFNAHSPANRFTKKAKVVFDEKAECPKWIEFLVNIFQGDGELIAFVQRWFGYCLTGRTDLDALLYAWGTGANGKSVLFETVRQMFDRYAASVPIDTLLAKRNQNSADVYALADLKGVRLVVSSEIPANRRFNESLVKDLTGGDRVKARNPYEKFFEFVPTHKLAIFGNHRLRISGTDHGIWRRIHLVPFQYTFQDHEKRERSEVIAEFMSESSGILNWLLAGCADVLEGGLRPPQSVQAATNDYRDEQDILGGFLGERCENRSIDHVRLSELFQAFRGWCEENGETASIKSSRNLSRELRQRGYKVANGSKNRVVVEGLSLNTG